MFGESESESPRVPSPWDTLMSSSPSPSPSPSHTPLKLNRASAHTPAPTLTPLPRLVPESDDGNVEYKLQLLSPSPARFARLVTQLKWRLLEGGGQAYYELGVADSGALVGLEREELEKTLETLEMMAGEIGASVVVVKEIEVPASWASRLREGEGGKRRKVFVGSFDSSNEGTDTSTAGTTETETEIETDDDPPLHDNSLEDPHHTLFAMDPDPDPADAEADDRLQVNSSSRSAIDIEITSVFKPRPVRTHAHIHAHLLTGQGKGKMKRPKKVKCETGWVEEDASANGVDLEKYQHHREKVDKAQYRRLARDRRREEKKKTLLARTTATEHTLESTVDVEITLPLVATEAAIVSGLQSLHVSVDGPSSTDHPDIPTVQVEDLSVDVNISLSSGDEDDDDDVFAPPSSTKPSFPKFAPGGQGESHLDVSFVGSPKGEGTRLIVEALVVRKMALEEAFLDFGGFSLS